MADDIQAGGSFRQPTPNLAQRAAPVYREPGMVSPGDVRMGASLVLQGDIRYGRTVNLHADGVEMIFEGPIPVTVNQTIRIGLMTGSCVLELPGHVESVRERVGTHQGAAEVASSGITIRFDQMPAQERLILTSLLEAFREPSMVLNLATLVVSQETGDFLLQVRPNEERRVEHDPFPFTSSPFASWATDAGSSSGWGGVELEKHGAIATLPPAAEDNERTFWAKYLEHSHFILNVPEYWQLLDRICRLMGAIDGETLILDAGCGQASLGQFMMIDQAYRNIHRSTDRPRAPQYLGVDFLPGALRDAQRTLNERAMDLSIRRPNPMEHSPTLRISLCCADLNRPLPFQENRFDCVVCNLTLGYLHDPLFSLRELLRILTPCGRVIVTMLKPVADPLRLYRSLLDHLERRDDRAEVRWMIDNWPEIQLVEYLAGKKIADAAEFQSLIAASGAVRIRTYPAFADQAVVVLAEKPSS